MTLDNSLINDTFMYPYAMEYNVPLTPVYNFNYNCNNNNSNRMVSLGSQRFDFKSVQSSKAKLKTSQQKNNSRPDLQVKPFHKYLSLNFKYTCWLFTLGKAQHSTEKKILVHPRNVRRNFPAGGKTQTKFSHDYAKEFSSFSIHLNNFEALEFWLFGQGRFLTF